MPSSINGAARATDFTWSQTREPLRYLRAWTAVVARSIYPYYLTMTKPRYDEGGNPQIRAGAITGRRIDALTCPYCGADNVLLSLGDIADDTVQIELYCDNDMCDVREFVIVAKRGIGLHRNRADVRALNVVDDGTYDEQRAAGYELELDERGRVTSRSAMLGNLDDPATHNAKVLARRGRPTHITVEPDAS